VARKVGKVVELAAYRTLRTPFRLLGWSLEADCLRRLEIRSGYVRFGSKAVIHASNIAIALGVVLGGSSSVVFARRAAEFGGCACVITRVMHSVDAYGSRNIHRREFTYPVGRGAC
jgi:hypothetical protein